MKIVSLLSPSMYRISFLAFLWSLIWVCSDVEALSRECLENPQSSNCIALGGYSPKFVDNLEISGAFMPTISTAYFLQFGYENVSTIKLRRSQVNNIDDDAFTGLNLLKRLDLSHNYIETLTTAGFRGLEGLEMLVLSFNSIDKIEEGALKSLSNLIYLNIRNNDLFDIPNEIQELNNLSYLDMSHNDFSNTDVIIKSNSLNFLRMSSCKIHSLTEDSFKGSPQLRLLDISKNFLTTLPDQLLLPLSSLEILDLSYNRLGSGFPNIYKPENLTELELSTVSDLYKYINKANAVDYSLEPNNEFMKEFSRWFLLLFSFSLILVLVYVYSIKKTENNFGKKRPFLDSFSWVNY